MFICNLSALTYCGSVSTVSTQYKPQQKVLTNNCISQYTANFIKETSIFNNEIYAYNSFDNSALLNGKLYFQYDY